MYYNEYFTSNNVSHPSVTLLRIISRQSHQCVRHCLLILMYALSFMLGLQISHTSPSKRCKHLIFISTLYQESYHFLSWKSSVGGHPFYRAFCLLGTADDHRSNALMARHHDNKCMDIQFLRKYTQYALQWQSSPKEKKYSSSWHMCTVRTQCRPRTTREFTHLLGQVFYSRLLLHWLK